MSVSLRGCDCVKHDADFEQPGGICTPLQRHFKDEDYDPYRKMGEFPIGALTVYVHANHVCHLSRIIGIYKDDNTPNWDSGIWKTIEEGSAT